MVLSMTVGMVTEDDKSISIPCLEYDDYQLLNRQTAFNRTAVEGASRCGCFHCGSIFPATLVKQWLTEEDGEDTAQCPYCEADAVIAGTETLPLSTALLAELYMKWFSREYKERNAEANYVLPFADPDDYLRKGIPFLLEKRTSLEVVGEIDLFPLSLLCEDFASLSGGESSDGCSDEGGKRYNGNEEYLPGFVEIKVHSEGQDRYLEFFDAAGKLLPYEPWTAGHERLVLSLIDQYGESLKGFVKDCSFGSMQLVVDKGSEGRK